VDATELEFLKICSEQRFIEGMFRKLFFLKNMKLPEHNETLQLYRLKLVTHNRLDLEFKRHNGYCSYRTNSALLVSFAEMHFCKFKWLPGEIQTLAQYIITVPILEEMKKMRRYWYADFLNLWNKHYHIMESAELSHAEMFNVIMALAPVKPLSPQCLRRLLCATNL
jgi:hypothetical protein